MDGCSKDTHTHPREHSTIHQENLDGQLHLSCMIGGTYRRRLTWSSTLSLPAPPAPESRAHVKCMAALTVCTAWNAKCLFHDCTLLHENISDPFDSQSPALPPIYGHIPIPLISCLMLSFGYRLLIFPHNNSLYLFLWLLLLPPVWVDTSASSIPDPTTLDITSSWQLLSPYPC